ncbi:fibrinogen-like YCDxxxxGGGW domain-containing protein [Archangium sp.]|uniref:fibrinogen-like YCDxxxxGGGW domain-containing protein n=1 Tax=Archangium sp. TaxID=1872627 RepID=UPI002D486678|nr:fibrinogen-like YCDxxxxGGGW domain-containing protein [Archangium sp.]HYO51193.1 fibrinogen-like YCDxxxxGGGW domain-containing protein [Archangium sp.]
MVAETPERYEFTLAVYDLLHDPDGSGLLRFEDYFTQKGSPHPSHDALTFPFYAASDGRTGGCTATSCKALLESNPATPSGLYTLDTDGTGPLAPFETWCDMTTDGGGWTLLATLTNNGDGANQGNWLMDPASQNNWESTSASFGTPDPSLNQDFRSPAFHSVPGQALMITHRNQFLLRTTEQCLGNMTLRNRFVGLGWECGGSESFVSAPACTHPCDIVASTPRLGDTVLLNGVTRSKLFFKTGEADGAQDTNKDRTYLATNYRDNVDYPVGLGAFCSGIDCNPRQGQADVNAKSDAITPAPGTEFYGLWIR